MPENNKRGMHGYFFFLMFISITFSLSLSLKGPLPEKQALNFTSINSSCRVLPLWIDGKRICCNMTSVAALSATDSAILSLWDPYKCTSSFFK